MPKFRDTNNDNVTDKLDDLDNEDAVISEVNELDYPENRRSRDFNYNELSGNNHNKNADSQEHTKEIKDSSEMDNLDPKSEIKTERDIDDSGTHSFFSDVGSKISTFVSDAGSVLGSLFSDFFSLFSNQDGSIGGHRNKSEGNEGKKGDSVLNDLNSERKYENKLENKGGDNSSGPNNPEKTRLWRAVEKEELADVTRYGDYNIHPNSTFKRFAFDEKSLDDFIKVNPDRTYTKTYIDIPKEKLELMYQHADTGGVGTAIGIDVYEHPEFYDWFEKVHTISDKTQLFTEINGDTEGNSRFNEPEESLKNKFNPENKLEDTDNSRLNPEDKDSKDDAYYSHNSVYDSEGNHAKKLGQVAVPKELTPQILGQRIENPVRQLVAEHYGFGLSAKKPNATGPDIVVPVDARSIAGFDIADVKKANDRAVKEFWKQIDNWRDNGWAGGPESFKDRAALRAALFVYDKQGNVYLYGFYGLNPEDNKLDDGTDNSGLKEGSETNKPKDSTENSGLNLEDNKPEDNNPEDNNPEDVAENSGLKEGSETDYPEDNDNSRLKESSENKSNPDNESSELNKPGDTDNSGLNPKNSGLKEGSENKPNLEDNKPDDGADNSGLKKGLETNKPKDSTENSGLKEGSETDNPEDTENLKLKERSENKQSSENKVDETDKGNSELSNSPDNKFEDNKDNSELYDSPGKKVDKKEANEAGKGKSELEEDSENKSEEEDYKTDIGNSELNDSPENKSKGDEGNSGLDNPENKLGKGYTGISGLEGSGKESEGRKEVVEKATKKGSANPEPGESLVGSSVGQMRSAALRIIREDPNHPLKFLLDESGKEFKPQRGLSHAELADRPDIVQMGHIVSNKLGGPQRLMLQDAWENQINNISIEHPRVGGAVLEQAAIDIGGIAVSLKTAKFWEEIGWLKPGTVSDAPRITF